MKSSKEDIDRVRTWAANNREKSNAIKRKWAKNNPEKDRRAKTAWQKANRSRILARRRELVEIKTGRKVVPRQRVPEEVKREKARLRSKRWYENNKHKIKRKSLATRKPLTEPQRVKRREATRRWRSRNKDHVASYDQKRRATNPQAAIKHRLCARITKILRRNKIRKTCNTITLIGCSWQFLKNYLQSQFVPGMSWENRDQWHIDHIRPCASFDLTEKAQQCACFHYTNLQPLWGHENMAKGSKWQEAA